METLAEGCCQCGLRSTHRAPSDSVYQTAAVIGLLKDPRTLVARETQITILFSGLRAGHGNTVLSTPTKTEEYNKIMPHTWGKSGGM